MHWHSLFINLIILCNARPMNHFYNNIKTLLFYSFYCFGSVSLLFEASFPGAQGGCFNENATCTHPTADRQNVSRHVSLVIQKESEYGYKVGRWPETQLHVEGSRWFCVSHTYPKETANKWSHVHNLQLYKNEDIFQCSVYSLLRFSQVSKKCQMNPGLSI